MKTNISYFSIFKLLLVLMLSIAVVGCGEDEDGKYRPSSNNSNGTSQSSTSSSSNNSSQNTNSSQSGSSSEAKYISLSCTYDLYIKLTNGVPASNANVDITTYYKDAYGETQRTEQVVADSDGYVDYVFGSYALMTWDTTLGYSGQGLQSYKIVVDAGIGGAIIKTGELDGWDDDDVAMTVWVTLDNTDET